MHVETKKLEKNQGAKYTIQSTRPSIFQNLACFLIQNSTYSGVKKLFNFQSTHHNIFHFFSTFVRVLPSILK